jgi:hypothetical protein
VRYIYFILCWLFLTNPLFSQDHTPPTAVCKNGVVFSLSLGTNYIYAHQIDNGSYDNVGVTKVSIRRMDDPCNIPSNLEFGSRIELCCADGGTRFMVVLQVEDAAGNIGQCMSEVIIQDKTTPSITCLPDITVNCKYRSYSPETFGRIVYDVRDRKKIIVDGKLWGLDGLVTGGCHNAQIEEHRFYKKGNCHNEVDTLIRTFTFRQFPSIHCVQKIAFIPVDRFEIRDQTCFNEDPTDGVIWPCDYETTDCLMTGGLSPDVTGRPELIKGDQCGLIATNFHDEKFMIPGTGCAKILRTWIVFDWCGGQQWSYLQKILVYESNPPVFTDCRDTVLLSQSPDCNLTPFNYRIDATDDCTPYDSLRIKYKLDIDYNNTIDIEAFDDSISIELPLGRHVLYIDIDDGCSNVTSCQKVIEVVDGKAPTPVCRTGVVTVIMPITGSVTIDAETLDVDSYDNCTDPANLKFSFSQDTLDRFYTIHCDSFGQSGQDSFAVDLYVFDEAGNKDYCTVNLIVQDPNQTCKSLTTATLQGFLLTPYNNIVGNVNLACVDMKTSVNVYQTAIENNKYAFDLSLPMDNWNAGVELSLEKNDEPLKGLSVADIIAIQRHLLGQNPIQSPEKLLAADVDNSGHVSVRDIIVLQRMILGLEREFPNGTPPWHFVDADLLENSGTISNRIMVENGATQSKPYNFSVIKTGDVNASWSLQSESMLESRSKDFVFYIDKNFSPNQDILAFSIRAQSISSLSGFQGTFEFDPGSLRFVNAIPGVLHVTEDDFNTKNVQEGVLPIVWSTSQGVSIDKDQVLFTLFFKVLNQSPSIRYSIDFGSNTILAQGVNAEGTIIKLVYNNANDNIPATYVNKTHPPYPNPSTGEVRFDVELTQDEVVYLTVFDLNGKAVLNKEFRLLKGQRSLFISEQDRLHSGMYLCSISSATFNKTYRLLLINPSTP